VLLGMDEATGPFLQSPGVTQAVSAYFHNHLPSFFNHDQQQINCFVHGSKTVNCHCAIAEIVGSNPTGGMDVGLL
jgi:hypothetical protein